MTEKSCFHLTFSIIILKQLRTLIVREVHSDHEFDQEAQWTLHFHKLHFAFAIHPPIPRKLPFEFVGHSKFECHHRVVKA